MEKLVGILISRGIGVHGLLQRRTKLGMEAFIQPYATVAANVTDINGVRYLGAGRGRCVWVRSACFFVSGFDTKLL